MDEVGNAPLTSRTILWLTTEYICIVEVAEKTGHHLTRKVRSTLLEAPKGGVSRRIPCVLILCCAERQSGELLKLVSNEVTVCRGKGAENALIAARLADDADDDCCNDSSDDNGDDRHGLTRHKISDREPAQRSDAAGAWMANTQSVTRTLAHGSLHRLVRA